jgi:hypothetical protein
LVEHFFTREDALAARAAWKQRLAGNPETLICIARWQADNASNTVKPKRRRPA